MPPAPLATSSASWALLLGVEHRRLRDRHEHEPDVLLADRADDEPAEVPLVHRDVGADLPAELLGVEGKGLVLVVHPELCVGDLDHRVLLVRGFGSASNATDGATRGFSKRAVLRAAVAHGHAVGDPDVRRAGGNDAR